jgi:DNA repair protein RadD
LLPLVPPIELRPYQNTALAQLDAAAARGLRRILLVAPVGAGKTTMAGAVIVRAAREGKRVLFLAHRRELIGQAYARFRAMGLSDSEVGVIMSSDPRRRPGACVQVASIDTLRTRVTEPFDVVFIDEAHRALSASYVTLSKRFPNALHIGLTATPFRTDGRGLGAAYDALVLVASVAALIDQGFLVRPRIFTVPQDKLPDLSKVGRAHGDYKEAELARAMDRGNLIGDIVEHWQTHAGGRRTLAFASSIAHSKHIVERFREVGVAAEHVDGKTPVLERDAIFHRLRSGDTRVVSNMGIATEGTDIPEVKCAILARPTESTGLYLQQVGRIMRPWNGEHALVLDHAGCAVQHGLPDEDREFRLDAPKRRRAAGLAPVKTCPSCYAVLPASAGTCPACGEEFAIERTAPSENVKVDLEEMTHAATDERRRYWDKLCATARDRGYKPGWAAHQFKARFRTWPPKSFPTTVRAPIDPMDLYAQIFAEVGQDEAWAHATFFLRTGELLTDRCLSS